MFLFPFTEMVQAMKKVACSGIDLTVEERNLLSVAYKNVIGARRASWRIITNMESKAETKGEKEDLPRIVAYREEVRFFVLLPKVVYYGV